MEYFNTLWGPMIKTVFFDVGSVLLSTSQASAFWLFVERKGIDVSAFKEYHSKFDERLCKGQLTMKDFFAYVENNWDFKHGAFKEWEKIRLREVHINKRVLSLARKLRKKFKVGVLTNVYDHTATLNKKAGLYKGFDPVIISCDIGMKKPDKEIFDFAVKKAKCKPEECILIDDMEENVRAAQSFGWKGIVFKDVNQLKSDLAALDVRV